MARLEVAFPDLIRQIEPGLAGVSNEEFASLVEFSLYWMYFEATRLENRASGRTIERYARKVAISDAATTVIFETAEYFRNRYGAGGRNQRYIALNFGESRGLERHAEKMLDDQRCDSRELLLGSLSVIYRYRNNLFHGPKWNYHLVDQEPNFRQAARLLAMLVQD